MGALRLGLTTALAGLLAVGCVFEDNCVGGAVRDEASGRCVVGGDGGVDGGLDGGTGGDGGLDAGPSPDGGADAMVDTDGGPPRRIVDVSVGAAHVCVVDNAGVLTCWGANQLGQLGTGDVSAQDRAVDIDLGAPVAAVSGSTINTCASTNVPETYCWGDNEHGQVGNGMVSAAPVTTPSLVSGLGAARDLYSGFATTCHVGAVGTVRCWGRNEDGQLGLGSVSPSQPMPGMPMREPGDTGELEPILGVSVGDKHVCAFGSIGLFCVGNNNDGVLGDGTAVDKSIPVTTFSMAAGVVSSVSAGQSHTCAVVGAEVWCWGNNDLGQVDPTGRVGAVLTPVRVDIPSETPRQVVVGSLHTCALTTSGNVWCWGSNAEGQIGDPAAPDPVVAPYRLPSLSNIERIDAAYGDVTCALDVSGALRCWGRDLRESLGSCAAGTGATMFLNGSCRAPAPILVDPYAM